MSNRLKDQSSPYLLQHAENPVDWFPWGSEAFEKAEKEDKPVFLSIGYSTCHWCHVMAHESFEDPETAELLNRYFVSVKVDREERPDIDSVYMSVCQEFTGSGGWPMSIFMTPQQRPFYAGTYFPPEARQGMIGFRALLRAIAGRWRENREGLLASAEQLVARISQQEQEEGSPYPQDLIERAAGIFAGSFDQQYGGFGMAPKFPAPHNLLFLLLYARTRADGEETGKVYQQVGKTLEQMRRGGIFDQIGFGFSRYSTDRYYLAPHFEKMLYDNALLILVYAAAGRILSQPVFTDTAEKTAEYIRREMTGPAGEFYSAQDADSQGEEGRYYLWQKEEILQILGKERGKQFCRHFGITRQGNFEGRNIPNLLGGGEISDAYEEDGSLLYSYRKSRAKLHLDDKVLTSWNSLMISALAVLYRVTGKQSYRLAAERAWQFIENNLADGDILYVGCRDGVRSVKGFLDDYAFYAAALINLYEVTAEPGYLHRARQICRQGMRQFGDGDRGGYFLYGTENGELIARPKETYDGALPCGNSVMAYCLARLSQIDGGGEWEEAARRQTSFLAAEADHYPAGHCMFLTALLLQQYPPLKVTIVLAEGDHREDILPRLPVSGEIRFLDGPAEQYQLYHGRTAYYVCHGYACLPPTDRIPDFTNFTTS